MPTNTSLLRIQFLDYVYRNQGEGYVCIATGTPIKSSKDKFEQSFFKWPSDRTGISKFLDGSTNKNVWFGVNLLNAPERTKAHCVSTDIIWADLDTCNPDTVEPSPQIVIETSPDRFQALWRSGEVLSPELAEEYAKRIYTKYKLNGVDSGWALTKLLRVPFTNNFKYGSSPDVKLLKVLDDVTLDVSLFENLVIEELSQLQSDDENMPDLLELPSPEAVIYAHRYSLKDTAFKDLYFTDPEKDWSAALWRLIKICLEAGMSREEAFVVAASSACNKYERDNRPVRHLWLDVVKADTANAAFKVISGDLDAESELVFPSLVTEEELDNCPVTFMNEYVDWATNITDATEQYHELSSAILLSSILADKLHLNAKHGKIIPNLWGLILGESTMTRKTTAMELAMSFVNEIDPGMIVATLDGSPEGLFTRLAERPERVSIYYRDEVSGFFNGMATKSYLAGMPETLTKLYDSPQVLTRPLRKETITINRPIFVFFGGGIQERVYESITEEFFYSGFLPRFLVVSGEGDIDNLQWMGPAEPKTSTDPRDKLKNSLHDLAELYQSKTVTQTLLKQQREVTKAIEVILTEDSWEKIREIEKLLTHTANNSTSSLIALPTFIRLANSLLRLSMLIGASRQEPIDFKITVELSDVIQAAGYIQKWAVHTVHMMSNVGTTTSERLIQRILRSIRLHPGVTRSEVMRRNHLQSLHAKIVFTTLEERGLIILKPEGRGYRIWPV